MIVVELAAHVMLVSRRAGVPIVPTGTVGKTLWYAYEPVAVPSVEPIAKSVVSPKCVPSNPVAATPATTGPMIGRSTVPVTPNDAPVGAMLSGLALAFSPIRYGAATPGESVVVQSAS